MTHPAPVYAWTDAAAMRAMVDRVAFAQLVVAVGGRPIVAHAPLSWVGDGIRFHLARANPIVAHLVGAIVVAIVIEGDAYVSPDWYGTADQVPTWNYRLVRMEGVARPLDAAETLDQLDRLSATHESTLAPKPAWTRDKLSPARMAALLRGLAGFGIEHVRLEGTAKLGHDKRPHERAGVVAGLRAQEQAKMAALMEATR